MALASEAPGGCLPCNNDGPHAFVSCLRERGVSKALRRIHRGQSLDQPMGFERLGMVRDQLDMGEAARNVAQSIIIPTSKFLFRNDGDYLPHAANPLCRPGEADGQQRARRATPCHSPLDREQSRSPLPSAVSGDRCQTSTNPGQPILLSQRLLPSNLIQS
jgi:hypothetical protein